MIKHYSTNDPLASRGYVATINAANQLVLRPTSPTDRLLKATYVGLPCESLDDLLARIGFTEM